MSWLSEGRLRPAISERVPLRDTPAALARLYDRKVTGKVVVLPEG
jgi:NADPH2:quinone reductase